MRRTTSKPKVAEEWYIGMEYLPGKFGTVKGPYSAEKKVLHIKSATVHHCILCKKDGRWFLTHKKNTGKWKEIEKGWKKIQMDYSTPQHVKRRTLKRKYTSQVKKKRRTK